MRCAFYDSDFPFCVGRLTGDDGCSGAIPKKAGANEDSRIIIEVRCGGANFHANDKGVAGLAGGDESGGLLDGRKSGSAPKSDEIEKGKRGGEAEALGEVACKAWADVAGAGGNKEGINVREFQARISQCFTGRGLRKSRRMFLEPGHHFVGFEDKGVCHLL
jgi:hypothetical protein